MKIAVYSPYLDSFGGGERYILTIAETLASGDSVDLLFNKHLYPLATDDFKRKSREIFNLDLLKVNFIKAPIGEGFNFLEIFFFFKKYDMLFYLTDGSIFYPAAKKNILHIQSPLVGQNAKSLWGKYKLKGWDLIIYNSNFTKENSQKNWPLDSKVIYPPVETNEIKPLLKKKYILSVGRFFGFLKDKKHGVLIEAFKDLFKNGLKDWSLHLVGSASEGDKEYLDQLKKISGDSPIEFHPNLEFGKLIKLYGESMIYWHAAGFGETDPTKMEHFGISTVEAMAGGCVPVVIAKGGQIEIVEDKKSGFLWENLSQLKEITLKLSKDKDLFKNISNQAIERSKNFKKEFLQVN